MKTIYWILIIVGAAILTVVATYLIQKQVTKSASDKKIKENLDAAKGMQWCYKYDADGHFVGYVKCSQFGSVSAT